MLNNRIGYCSERTKTITPDRVPMSEGLSPAWSKVCS